MTERELAWRTEHTVDGAYAVLTTKAPSAAMLLAVGHDLKYATRDLEREMVPSDASLDCHRAVMVAGQLLLGLAYLTGALEAAATWGGYVPLAPTTVEAARVAAAAVVSQARDTSHTWFEQTLNRKAP